MAPHLTHVGVHDHGFNNVSTYGNLWRLAREGKYRGRGVGAALLRAGAEGDRRGAGAPLDADSGRRVHLLVQRRALAVRRYHSHAARAGALARAWTRLFDEQDVAGEPARAPAPARARDGRVQRVLRSTGATSTMSAAARRTRACSTPPTAPIAARARSRATRRSPHGRADWHGRCWVLPSSWSFWRRSIRRELARIGTAGRPDPLL